MIYNQTTVINIQAETVRETTQQITVDMNEIERKLRELEQQADEDERLAREVRPSSSSSSSLVVVAVRVVVERTDKRGISYSSF